MRKSVKLILLATAVLGTPAVAGVRYEELNGVKFTFKDFWRSDGHVYTVNAANENDQDVCVSIRVDDSEMLSPTLLRAGESQFVTEYYVPRHGTYNTQMRVKGADNGQCS